MHKQLIEIVKKLPTDFEPFGQRNREGEHWQDCSVGCKHFLPLPGTLKTDWGVCTNNLSPRAGLLTFEHQGCEQFEYDECEDREIPLLDSNDPYMLYIILNSELGLTAGKYASAAGHAVHLFMQSYTELAAKFPLSLHEHTLLDRVALWNSDTYRKITLRANTLEIQKITQLIENCFPVIDAGHKIEVSAGTITAVSLWPMKKSDAPK